AIPDIANKGIQILHAGVGRSSNEIFRLRSRCAILAPNILISCVNTNDIALEFLPPPSGTPRQIPEILLRHRVTPSPTGPADEDVPTRHIDALDQGRGANEKSDLARCKKSLDFLPEDEWQVSVVECYAPPEHLLQQKFWMNSLRAECDEIIQILRGDVGL